MNIKFDKEYWISNLKKEVGLENVPYCELGEHTLYFSLYRNENAGKNAKEYVDEQLALIENQYKEFESSSDIEFSTTRMIDGDDVMISLMGLAASIDSFEIPEDPFANIKNNTNSLQVVEQTINHNDISYYDVQIGENTFTVAINSNSRDFRVKDQINHVINTSFFVEQRHPLTFDGSENIISYYQFVNAIQPYLKISTNLAQEKILAEVKTTFDGIKLDSFLN